MMRTNWMKRMTVAGIFTIGMLATGSPLAAAPRFSVGVGIGAPVAVYPPPCPGPGYFWVDGFYSPAGVWIGGYWASPIAVRRNFGHATAGFRGGDHDRGRR